MSKVFKISPAHLTIDMIEEIITGDFVLELSEESVALISRCREYLDDKITRVATPVYGVTTGFGALYNKSISHDQLSLLQKNLVMSHACGTGNEVSETVVKLMLLLKVHALSLGLSGVQVSTVRALLALFNKKQSSHGLSCTSSFLFLAHQLFGKRFIVFILDELTANDHGRENVIEPRNDQYPDQGSDKHTPHSG